MMTFTSNGNEKQESRINQASFVKSQWILLQSRKKWGILYSLATVSGLFFIPGVLGIMGSEVGVLAAIQKGMPLPVISFFITIGMFVLNDLVDSDLDRANGKKRPIPSGQVSKRQTWTFIISTNGAALVLAAATLNPVSVIIVALMLAIGIVYSDPKIAMMKRFVLKTVTIAMYYCLCALLGATSFGMDLAASNPIILIHALLMLAIMIFISSTLNDLGDVEGDKQAGRRTVPIVIGKDGTIKLSMILAMSMLPATWMLFVLADSLGGQGNIITAVTTSIFALFVASKMAAMRKGQQDMESMRRHHKKLFPLNLVLQSNLVAGGVMPL